MYRLQQQERFQNGTYWSDTANWAHHTNLENKTVASYVHSIKNREEPVIWVYPRAAKPCLYSLTSLAN